MIRMMTILGTLLALAAPAAAQSNRCDEPQGDVAVTVPSGTLTRLGFCHNLRDSGGNIIGQPQFLAVTSLGEAPLTVLEVGQPLPDGRRWFESTPFASTQSLTARIVAVNASGRSLPSEVLTLSVSAAALVPSSVTVPRIMRP